MSDRDYLSELEQLAMLAVLRLGGDAYGAAIRQDLEETADRPVSIATIYVALGRLEERGLVRSWMSEPTPVRGGRSKRLYEIRRAGVAALRRTRTKLDRMWAGVDLPADAET